MPGTDRLTALTAVLVGVMLLPTAAFAAPERVSVCHQTAATPDGREWVQLEVSSRSLQHHLAHGDLTPGEVIPGTETHLDADCVPQSSPATEPPSEPPQIPETVFAIAYSDMDPSSDGYDPAVDVLIAKLIDGPDAAADGVVGPGDVVITARYPKDFSLSEFGDFTVTEHTVTSITLASNEYSCFVVAGDASFVFSSGDGDFDLYQEWFSSLSMTRLHDKRTEAVTSDDAIQINSASPSQPTDGIDLLGSAEPLNHPFVEVEANCEQ